MIDKTKKISSEAMLQILKKLNNGESVKCPLCEIGILQSTENESKSSHSYACNQCETRLNID